MYEMYPEAWPATVDQRQPSGSDDKPRRRLRKEHSVVPRVLSQLNGPAQFAPPAPAPPR